MQNSQSIRATLAGVSKKVGAGLLSVLVAAALGSSNAEAMVCERGYVSEIIESARDTASLGALGYPRLLFRADSTGFSPPDSGAKVTVNGKSYSEIQLWHDADSDIDQMFKVRYQTEVAAIKAAFLAKAPVRVWYFSDNCSGPSNLVEITMCSSEISCNR